VIATLREVGFVLGGLVAAEGSFVVSRVTTPHANGDPRVRFVFQLTMARRDRALLEALRQYLGFGSIGDRTPSNPRWQPQSTFVINSRHAHRAATIPFAERFLQSCDKRRQFELWVQAMDVYDRAHPSRYLKGPGTCAEPGCESPVRGRGLCRRHYYRATGY
jgi:hypothetical protein